MKRNVKKMWNMDENVVVLSEYYFSTVTTMNQTTNYQRKVSLQLNNKGILKEKGWGWNSVMVLSEYYHSIVTILSLTASSTSVMGTLKRHYGFWLPQDRRMDHIVRNYKKKEIFFFFFFFVFFSKV